MHVGEPCISASTVRNSTDNLEEAPSQRVNYYEATPCYVPFPTTVELDL